MIDRVPGVMGSALTSLVGLTRHHGTCGGTVRRAQLELTVPYLSFFCWYIHMLEILLYIG